MKTRVFALAMILGLAAVTVGLAQSGTGEATPRPSPADASAPRSPDKPRGDRPDLHAAIARLRAEVEILQLEHDLAREWLSGALKDQAGGLEGSPSRRAARDYMRIGAEIVGKGSEFESAMQDRSEEIWKAVDKSVAAPPPADIDRLKQDFLRVATELNRKKIELVGMEIHLEGSM